MSRASKSKSSAGVAPPVKPTPSVPPSGLRGAGKWRFVGVFLVSFAVLEVLWAALNVAGIYRSVVLATTQLVSPVINGWWLDYGRPGLPAYAVFRAGERQLKVLLELPTLSMGAVPLLALIIATPRLGWKRIIVTGIAGSVLYALVDVLVLLAYPFVIDHPNAFKDTLGVFSGLVAFVVAPLGLWFSLTYSALRNLWQLTPPAPPARPAAR